MNGQATVLGYEFTSPPPGSILVHYLIQSEDLSLNGPSTEVVTVNFGDSRRDIQRRVSAVIQTSVHHLDLNGSTVIEFLI